MFVASRKEPTLPDPIQGISRLDTAWPDRGHKPAWHRKCSETVYMSTIDIQQQAMLLRLSKRVLLITICAANPKITIKATTQVKLLYCSPAWSAFCSAGKPKWLESFLLICIKWLAYCSLQSLHANAWCTVQTRWRVAFHFILNDEQPWPLMPRKKHVKTCVTTSQSRTTKQIQ